LGLSRIEAEDCTLDIVRVPKHYPAGAVPAVLLGGTFVDFDVMQWLSAISGAVIRTSIVLFVVVNAVALAVFAVKRDRSLVQRWTSPWLATNLVLVGAGVGTPLLVGITKFAITALAGAGQMAVSFVK